MLTKRDKAIISDLNRFRVMDRDSIAELHFAGLKNSITGANTVLLRLLRDGHIQRSTHFQPYVYFGADTQIKKNSAKIPHWLGILGVYRELRRLGDLGTFLVEPKYGAKGVVEPDIYCQYRKTGFFVEVQKTLYTEKQMTEKLDRYVDLFNSGVIEKPFPHVLILSEVSYGIGTDYPFRVFQSRSFSEFVQSLKPQAQPVKSQESGGVKIKIG